MEDKKIKVTIEENGKVINSWEGSGAYISVCTNEGADSITYGHFNTLQLATMINSLRQEIKCLLDKYGDKDLEFLLALYEMRDEINTKEEKDADSEGSSGGDKQ